MKKMKCFIMILFAIILLWLIPNISNAAVEYTKIFASNDGSIILNLTGLTLDENKAYL